MEASLARLVVRRCTAFVHPGKWNFPLSCLYYHNLPRSYSVILRNFSQPKQPCVYSALHRALSSDDHKPYSADNGSPHVKPTELFQKILQDQKNDRFKKSRKHIMETREKLIQTQEKFKQTQQEKLKQTQEKLKVTQQRMKESKERIIQDIRDTRTMMKERMEEVIERENIWTIPNVLCVTRIIFSPFLGYLIVESDFNLALNLLVLAGVTDVLDGWIARTWKSQSSKLGSFLDPMADKVLIATLFISLTYVNLIPVALTSLIIARDLILVAAGFHIRYKSLPPPRTFRRYFDATHATAQLAPTTISKVNTMVQLAMVASTLGAPVFNYVDHPALYGLWFLTAGTTVASALSYIISKNTYKFLQRKKR